MPSATEVLLEGRDEEVSTITETCYMCESTATGREHVPPNCIFPERKDLPPGVDYRKQLFKVPSCDTHNMQKSRDDEYFLYILGGCFLINDVGRMQYKTKIRRAAKRNQSVLARIASRAFPCQFSDRESEANVSSIAHEVDEDRFNCIIDRMSRALYFHHFQEKWNWAVKYQAEFMFPSTDAASPAVARCKAISALADEWFEKTPYYGKNPKVFQYQALDVPGSRKMRLHFYEGCKLLLLFKR